MRNFLSKFQWHIYLVLCGLLFLFIMDSCLQVTGQTFIFPDSVTYIIAAEKWYQSLSADELRPLIGAIINGFPLLFGSSEDFLFRWSLIVNIICWLSVILMLYEILKGFLLQKWAFLFSIAYIFCVGNTIFVFHLLAESIFTFLLFAVFYLTKKYWDSKKFIYLSLAISVLIISVMVKPASKILMVLFLIYFSRLLWQNWKKKEMFLVYGSLSVLILQIALMKAQHGNFTISYIDTLAYYNYLGTRAEGYKTGEPFRQFDNARSTYFGTLSYPEQKVVGMQDLKDHLQNNTANLIRAYFKNMLVNSIGGSTAIEMCENHKNSPYFDGFKFTVKVLAKLQNIFFSFFGVLLALYFLVKIRHTAVFYTFISLLILYIVAISGISSDQGDRFHILIFPFVLMLTAKFLKDKTKILD